MEDNKPEVEAQDTCSFCLDKVRRGSKIYVCPKCGCTLHERCLVEYLTGYNFNRCFCMSCNRFFPNEEMKEHLKPMKYKEYVKKQIDTFNEQFMLQTMTKTNDLLFYYEKMCKICTHLKKRSQNSVDEFQLMIYFIHRFNPIDLKTFIESKGLTYQDPNDMQIEEDVVTDETTNIRKQYEQIWQFQETMIKQVHQWHGNPFQISLYSVLPFPHSFGQVWASCAYKVLYLDAFDPWFKRLIDEFQDMPNEFIPKILDGFCEMDINDIGKKVKKVDHTVEIKPTAFMMCSECKGLVVCINKHVYCS